MNRLKGLISLCVFLVDRGRNHIEICPFWSFLDKLKISPVQTTILTQSTVLICFFSSSAMSAFFLGGYPRYITCFLYYYFYYPLLSLGGFVGNTPMSLSFRLPPISPSMFWWPGPNVLKNPCLTIMSLIPVINCTCDMVVWLVTLLWVALFCCA